MRFLSLLALLLAALTPLAASATPAAPATNVDSDGVAMRGYDPVAYFTVGKPV